MKRLLPWLIALLVVAGAGFGWWRWHLQHGSLGPTYKTAPVEKRRIVGKVTASGTLSAIVTVQVGTQVSGRIQKLFADFNSEVKKGELVAKIDPQLFEAAHQQAEANYLQAKAGVATAQATALAADKAYVRTKALKDQNLAAQSDLDTAEANVAITHASIDAANANLAQAAAQLHQSEVNLSYTSIQSPIDGVVISRNVDVGQTVAASLSAPIIFTIAQDLTKMQVDTNVSEGDVGRLQVGMKTYFTVDSFPGQRFFGAIRQIRNAATTVQNVVTYDAVIDVDNKDLRLRPGMTANVTIVYAERKDAVAISNAALRFRPPASLGGGAASSPTGGGGAGGGGSSGGGRRRGGAGAGSGAGGGGDAGTDPDAPEEKTVWAMRGGAPAQVKIHAGLTDGTVTEVVDGLSEGDQVVVDVEGGDTGAVPASTARPPGATGGGGGGLRF